jgi:hypothetical protein
MSPRDERLKSIDADAHLTEVRVGAPTEPLPGVRTDVQPIVLLDRSSPE